MEVEHGTFTPLVFTTTGGMADECKRFHSRLVELISIKKGEEYSTTISWICSKVSFTLLKSALFCLRGSRTTRHVPLNIEHCDFEVEKEQVGSLWAVVLWKFHELLMKNPWKSFHGPWILQNEISLGYFWPWNFHELGEFFHDPWVSSKSTLMTHWFAVKVTRINFMTHEFLYKPIFMTHEFLQSLLSWPIGFLRKSSEWISCPWIAIKQHFMG